MVDVVTRWRHGTGQAGVVVLEGFHALKHALRFGAEVLLMVTDDPEGVLELAAQVAPDVRDRLAGGLEPVPDLAGLIPRPHPTRVAALAHRPSPARLREALYGQRAAPVVLLDGPRRPGNAGAVVRLAAGFGVAGVLTTGTLDPWHPAVVRGAAGLHFATAVHRSSVDDLPAGPVYGLDPDGADLRTTVLPDDAVLAFGSERQGLSGPVRARCHQLVALPMRPLVSSYNLATSVAMTLYHWALPPLGSAGRTFSRHITG